MDVVGRVFSRDYANYRSGLARDSEAQWIRLRNPRLADEETDVRAGDDQHAIPQAALRDEAGFEKGDFRGGERTSGHAAKMVAWRTTQIPPVLMMMSRPSSPKWGAADSRCLS